MADVTVSYKGTDIVELNDSGTKTLFTQGKYCEDNITLSYTKSGGDGVVAFINVTYKAGYTISCSNGITTLTSDISGNYIFALDATGDWTLSLGTKTKTINASYGNTYYVRGFGFDALPDTDRSNNNVLAEAYYFDYNGSTDWGNWTLLNDFNIFLSNDALRMYGTGKAIYTLSNLNQSFTIYGAIKGYATTGTQRLLDVYFGYSSGNEQMFFSNSGRIAYSSYLDDTTISGSNVNITHAYAMSFNGTTKKVKFYLDGVFLAEKSCNTIGQYLCVAGSYGATNYDVTCDVYFAAVVNETESDATIIANQQEQMSLFNI